MLTYEMPMHCKCLPESIIINFSSHDFHCDILVGHVLIPGTTRPHKRIKIYKQSTWIFIDFLFYPSPLHILSLLFFFVERPKNATWTSSGHWIEESAQIELSLWILKFPADNLFFFLVRRWVCYGASACMHKYVLANGKSVRCDKLRSLGMTLLVRPFRFESKYCSESLVASHHFTLCISNRPRTKLTPYVLRVKSVLFSLVVRAFIQKSTAGN